jgi:hydrogenase-4 component E
MNIGTEAVLLLVVLTNLLLLGSSRLVACIRIAAFQGVLLGLLLTLAHAGEMTARIGLLALGGAGLKGVVFPWLLRRGLREAHVRREVEPFVGFTASLLIGVAALMVSVWLGVRLPLPRPAISPLVVPAAFFSIMAGLFLIVGRRQALMQVLGYLVLENGVFTFGVALAQESPMLFELGMMLDVFVAVFVMGIAMFHISREFDHIDTERLSELRDWTE